MLLGIDKPNIPTTAGYTHTATSWQVCKTLSFKDEDLVLNIEKSSTNLLEYVFDYEQEHNEVLYCRVKLHFSNDKETTWSKVINLDSCQTGTKFSNTVVATPVVYTKYVNNDYPLGGFIIECSPFILYSGVGHHAYTSWSIEDSNGNVVWSREKDNSNLYKIRVPDDILKNNKSYVIVVTHHTDTNTMSNYGKLPIATGTVLDSPITIFKSSIIADINRLYMDISINTPIYDSILVEVTDGNGKTVGTYAGDKNVVVECIETINMGELYFISARVKYSDSKFSMPVKETVVGESPLVQICNPTPHVYDNKFKTLGGSNMGENLHITEELPGGLIPIFRVGHDTMSLFRYNGTYSLIEVGISNIELPDSSSHIIKLLPNNKLLISYQVGGYFKFSVYDYNILTYQFTHLKTIDRDNENIDRNMLNNLTILNNNEVLYLDDHKIKKFNVDTYSLTTVTDELIAREGVNIISVCDNEIITLFGGNGNEVTNNIIYKYNIKDNTWTDIGVLPDEMDLTIHNRASFHRDDNKIIFFNQDTDDTHKDQSIWIYDHKLNNWTKSENVSVYDKPFLSVIKLLDKTYLRYNDDLVIHYT